MPPEQQPTQPAVCPSCGSNDPARRGRVGGNPAFGFPAIPCSDPFHQPPPDGPEEERVWTICVCPGCGGPRGDVFGYEPADDAWCCERCDNYPSPARAERVVRATQPPPTVDDVLPISDRCGVEMSSGGYCVYRRGHDGGHATHWQARALTAEFTLAEQQRRAERAERRIWQGKHDFLAVKAERDAARQEYRNLLKAGEAQDSAFAECIEQRAELFDQSVDLHQRLSTQQAELDALREGLRFYANEDSYSDWHDTGRTERQSDEERDETYDVPVWESTISEDSGALARSLLNPSEPAPQRKGGE